MNSNAQRKIEREREKRTGELDLSNWEITEVPSDLLGMDWLIELNLSNNQITEIKNLEALTNLQWLNLSFNQITEIKNLEALTNLQILNLSVNQITEIKRLEALTNLQSLDLFDNRITEIKNLEALANLQSLDLSKNQITKIKNLEALINLPGLDKLFLFGISDNNLHIPAELFGKFTFDNCLQALKGYFASLKHGIIHTKEMPIILVGNSTAGKTSLRCFLKEGIFPPTQDYSTHGIEVDIWHPQNELLENLSNTDTLKNTEFYIWDFGGQEYYHSTHRLFFRPKALYILLWEQKTNKQACENIRIRLQKENGEVEESTKPVDVFPYEYWLSSIRNLAPVIEESPVLLIQNKIDENDNNKEGFVNEQLVKNNNCSVRQLSLKTAYEYKQRGKEDPNFQLFLKDLFLKAHQLNSIISYGALWDDLKRTIKEREAENIWTAADFLNVLHQKEPNTPPESMLSYGLSLRAMGFIFYYPEDEYLKNYVFINPGWVTQNIYSILDYSVQKNGGEFNNVHVENKVGKERADLFIALMKKFELIFYNEELQSYIAPQYLPSTLNDVRKWNEWKEEFDFAKPDFTIRFAGFMPRYIMLRFLAAYGDKAKGKYYWKNGIAFLLEKESVLVLSNDEKKQFAVFTQHHNLYVQRLVYDKLFELSENKSTLQIAVGTNDFVEYSALGEQYRLQNTNIQSVEGNTLPIFLFKHFFENIEIVKQNPINNQTMNGTPDKIKLFISYAHVDEEIREIFENIYLKAIQNHYDENVVAWSDKGIKPGTNWDAKIKSEIENADVILFFISNAFLASNYIKNVEIDNAIKRFKEKRQIIVPIYIEEVSKKMLPFSEKQYLPGAKPLKKYKDRNAAWVKLQDGVITIVDDIKSGKSMEYFE